MNRVFFVITLAGSLLLGACAAPRVKTTKLVSARFSEAAKLKDVAVLPFDGQDGGLFATELEAVLAGISVNDKRFFALVDRAKLNSIMNEMKLAQSSLVNAETAAQIGNVVGAKGIYTGVFSAKAQDTPFRENRTRCAYTVTKYDKRGNPYEECAKYESYQVECKKRVARVTATPKLIEVETARIVYSNTLEGTSSSSACSDSRKPIAPASELIEEAKRQVKEKFRLDVAPHYVSVEIQLMKGKTGITSEESARRLKMGLEYAENDRFDRACELWDEALKLSPDAPSLLYNLGICAETGGDLDRAMSLYQRADRNLGEPDKDIAAALRRISADIRNRQKLKEQVQ